jgi:hypothetical protein
MFHDIISILFSNKMYCLMEIGLDLHNKSLVHLEIVELKMRHFTYLFSLIVSTKIIIIMSFLLN